MRVLITGAAGYVARFVASDLEHDHDIVLCSRRNPAEVEHGPRTTAPYVRADLTNLEDCRRVVEGIDMIVHIGANNWVASDTFYNNSMSTYNLLEAMREVGIKRMIFASSNCALGHCSRPSGKPFPVRYFPIDEQHPADIEDNYGLSKVVNEETLSAYAKAYGIESVSMRLAWCNGPDEYAMREQRGYDAANGVGGFWAYVDMRDVAQAFRLALKAPVAAVAACRAYYINAADTLAAESSAELIERFYPQYHEFAEKLSGHASFFSWEAAHRDLGYTPQYSWRA